MDVDTSYRYNLSMLTLNTQMLMSSQEDQVGEGNLVPPPTMRRHLVAFVNNISFEFNHQAFKFI